MSPGILALGQSQRLQLDKVCCKVVFPPHCLQLPSSLKSPNCKLASVCMGSWDFVIPTYSTKKKKMTAFFFFFEVYFKQFSFFLMSLIHVCSCVLCSFNGEVFKYREEKEKLALFSSFFASLFVTSNSYLTDHLQIMGCLQCSAFRRWCLFFFSFLIFL